jgi:hypothetical protein
MTRTDVMASSGPRTPRAASTRRGSPGFLRGLSVLPVALLLLALALLVPSTAAAESTSGYSQEPTKPTTTPSKGTSPSEETKKATTTPAKETVPATTSTTPTTSEKATTLPFTGFDLRWDIGFGLLLMGAGFSIVVMQRRQRRQRGR